MRRDMKRITALVFTLMLVMGIVSFAHSQVRKIIGINSYGPEPDFPTTVSLVCDGTGVAGNNCPQYWSPDFSDTDETNAFGYTNQTPPGRCLKSTNAAVSWSYCGSDPFTTSYNSQPASFGVASNGALLAAVNVNNTTQACVIKRSTDGGDTWTTVFTQNGTYFCGAWNTTALPSTLKCAKSAANCVLYGWDTATTVSGTVWYSTDYGLTWSHSGILVNQAGSSPVGIGPAVSDDGNSIIAGVTTGQTSTTFIYSRDGTTFAASAAWGTKIGASRCLTGFIYGSGSDPAIGCGANNSTGTWEVMRLNANVPTTITQLTPGNGAPTSAQSPDLLIMRWDENTYYLVTRIHSTGQPSAFVTTDSFSSLHYLGSVNTTTVFGSTPRGDIYKWRNSVYWSSGYFTPTGHIMRIS